MYLGCPPPAFFCRVSEAVVVNTPNFQVGFYGFADGSSSTGISYELVLTSVFEPEPTVSHLEVSLTFLGIFLLCYALFRSLPR